MILHILDPYGRNQKIFVRFLVQMRTRKFASEIYLPLEGKGKTGQIVCVFMTGLSKLLIYAG